jgi:hypothetical protein
MSQPPGQPPYGSVPPPGAHRPPPGDRRPTGLIAAVVIGALVVVGGIVGAILLLGGGDDAATSAADPSVGPSSAPTSEPADPTEPTEPNDPTDPTATTSDPATSPPSDRTDSAGSPQTTADAFVAAVRARDCATVDALTTADFGSTIDCQTDFQMPADVTWALGDPEIFAQGGDSAMARVVMRVEGYEVSILSRLVRVGDDWRVDSIDLSDLPSELPQR